MHVLILENNINIDNFVNSIKENKNVGLIFCSQDAICNVADVTKLDIESDEVSELLEFSIANEIGFVFAFSDKAQNTEIIKVFEANGIKIFGSSQNQYEFLLSRTNVKKMIYKNKIPTLKFAVFEKEQSAYDWCKNANYPILILSDAKDEVKQNFYVNTYFKAESIINNLFQEGYDKIVIQEAVEGHYFSSYYLTDSISHVNLANIYKNNDLEVCPDFQLTPDIIDYLFNEYYLKILNSINYNVEPFSGILKLDFVVIENEIFLIDVDAKCNKIDFQILLQILDVDIFDLFSSLSIGILEDWEGCYLLKDNYFAGLKKNSKDILYEEDDNIECMEIDKDNFLYLSQASTVNRACGYLTDEI